MQSYDTMVASDDYIKTMQVCTEDANADGEEKSEEVYTPQFAKLITKEGKEPTEDWAAKLQEPKDALAKYKNMSSTELKTELSLLETRMDEELVLLRRDFDFRRFPIFAALDAMR